MVYQIRIEGHLGPLWADAFDGLSITLEDDGHTLVTGPAIDQAALHGLLRKIRDLGMPLVSVILVDGGPVGVPTAEVKASHDAPTTSSTEREQ